MLLYLIIGLLTILVIAEAAVICFLSVDPNYGILNATAGLFLIRMERRRRDLILLDLDNFKAYNSRHGHTGADTRVRSALKALRFRRSDGVRVVKRGGDELLISCPSGRADEVTGLARLRLAGVELTATACIGRGAADVTAMLIAAERAILDAKSAGHKNTVLYLGVLPCC